MNQSSQVIEAENLRVLRGRVEVLDIPSFYSGRAGDPLPDRTQRER